MSSLSALLKLQLKVAYGSPAALRRIMANPRDAFDQCSRTLIGLLVALGLMASYAVMLSKVFGPLRDAGFEQLVLLSGILVPMVVVLVLGLFQVLGTFFFARDAEHLASLPIPARTVFAAKLGVVMVGQYALAIPILAVPTVYYGVEMGCGIAYYVRLIVLALLIPALPVATASLASLLLMRVVSAVRKRSAVLSLGGFALMVAFIAGEMTLINAASKNMTGQLIEGLVKDQVDLIAMAGRYFPPIRWAVTALADPGVAGVTALVLFAVASVAAAGLAVVVSSAIYQKGALAQAETERGTIARKLKVCRQSSATTAIFLREWRVILRTPVYALNGLVGIVLGPLMVNPSLFGGVVMKDPAVKPFFDRLASADAAALAMLLVAGVLAAVGLINTAAPTTVSREGKTFWLSKVIPVPPGQQVTAKFLAGYSISVLSVLTTAVVLCPSFHIHALPALAGVALALVALYPIVAAGVLLDIVSPKLAWNNPTEAIKQNMNALYAMAVGSGLAAGGGYIGYGLFSRGVALGTTFAVLMALYLSLGVAAHTAMVSLAERRYRTMGA